MMARIPWRLVAWLVAIIIMVVAVADKARSEQPVDVALLLAVDVSGSVTDDNFKLQRDGIADAIGSPAFGMAITSGAHGQIAVLVMEWGSDAKVVIGWTVLSSRADARALAGAIRGLSRTESGATCMGAMLMKAATELAPWAGAATRRVIDVSGDGADNCNVDMSLARQMVIDDGITINGLPIVTVTEPKIDEWYEAKLIGGPGAFTVIAEGFESFASAMLWKLTIEVAEARP